MIVSQPIAVRAESRRRSEERLGLLFPAALAATARAAMSLPPRSRLRQALVYRFARLGIEAANRRDYEAAFMLYHDNVEANFSASMVALGFASEFHGREARLAAERSWAAEWGDFRYEPNQLVDLGDERLLLVGSMSGSGPKSGAAVSHEWAVLLTIARGRVVRDEAFFEHREAREAAGLVA